MLHKIFPIGSPFNRSPLKSHFSRNYLWGGIAWEHVVVLLFTEMIEALDYCKLQVQNHIVIILVKKSFSSSSQNYNLCNPLLGGIGISNYPRQTKICFLTYSIRKHKIKDHWVFFRVTWKRVSILKAHVSEAETVSGMGGRLETFPSRP